MELIVNEYYWIIDDDGEWVIAKYIEFCGAKEFIEFCSMEYIYNTDRKFIHIPKPIK